MALPEGELDALLAHVDAAGGILGRAHRYPRVDRRAAGLDSADDRPRRVEAADALQPVLDLTAPVALDDDDEVQDARRGERLVLLVVLLEQVAQRRLDGGRRRVLGVPDRLLGGAGGHGSDRPPAVAGLEQPVRLLRALRACLVVRERRAVV